MTFRPDREPPNEVSLEVALAFAQIQRISRKLGLDEPEGGRDAS